MEFTTEQLEEILRRLPDEDRRAMLASLEKLRLNEAQRAYDARIVTARDKLIEFACATMPDLSAKTNNPLASRYRPARHHRAIAAAMEAVEAGKIPYIIITMPPRHGKSELAAKRMAAWFIGRDPYRQVMFGTYSDELAGDTGREVREIMRTPEYGLIFPEIGRAHV